MCEKQFEPKYPAEEKCCDDPYNPKIVHCANPCHPIQNSIKQAPIVQDWREELEEIWKIPKSDIDYINLELSDEQVKVVKLIEKVVAQQVSKALEEQEEKIIEIIEYDYPYSKENSELITKIKQL